MAGRVLFSAGLSALILVVLVHEISCSSAEDVHLCAPSSCGDIHNISYPFRLKDHPQSCGDQRSTLSCEKNQTVLHLYAGKYFVRQINYENYRIRVVDSGIHHLSIPLHFLNYNNFSHRDPYAPRWRSEGTVVFLMCENSVNSPFYLETSTCFSNIGDYSSNSSKRYRYVKVGITNAADVEDSCQIERMVPTSWPGNDDPNISCSDVHNALVYGFELSWLELKCVNCGSGDSCYLDDANRVFCDRRKNLLRLILLAAIDIGLLLLASINNIVTHSYVTPPLGLVRCFSVLFYSGAYHALITVLGTPCVIAFLIYKWRRRHLSMYDAVEEFLQTHNNLMPIRYSYSEIKKMTKNFKDKLGEGGYGTVYKGTLRSGRLVAIKMLGKSKANGQDFINEVATIGRIHHVNIVQLIGFSIQRSKRALIYEFMPKGSLNKYIFSLEESIVLGYKKIYDIAIGIARGIEYLHRGCDMQILHFDIKPHNILLDENFTPKVSDFGLAQLYPIDNSIVSLTAARGTLGYIAPELFYRNIGGVSYKADVYSFGMLLMEMAGRRKNLNALAEHSSQIYLPTWIYDQLHDEKEIGMEDAIEEEKKMIKKVIIVALWCIQMKPNDRPSMSNVLKMLEGEVEYLQMPPKPSLSSLERPIMDVGENSNETSSSMQSNESSQSTHLFNAN